MARNTDTNRSKETLQAILILAASLLTSNLVALPSDNSPVACGFENAKFTSLMLPVLPGDPLEKGRGTDIVFDLLISPEGKLIANGAFYAPGKEYLPPVADALHQSLFFTGA